MQPCIRSYLAITITLIGCSGAEPALSEAQGGAGAGGTSGTAASSAGASAGTLPGPNAAGTSGAGGAVAGNGAVGGVGGGISGGAGTASNPGGAASGGSAGHAALPVCESNQVARCSGTSPIHCDLGGGTGDFMVTLDLGTAASTTYVEAEAHRRVLGSVDLAAGETKRFTFGVSVRQPEGQPIQDVPAGTPGLQLYLSGDAPTLIAVCVE